MAKTYVNSSIKLKSGGGINNGIDGLFLGDSAIAGEVIVAGNPLKIIKDSSGNYRVAKMVGTGTATTAYTGGTAGYYSSVAKAFIPLTEDRFIFVWDNGNQNNEGQRRVICAERQPDGSFLAGTDVLLDSWDQDSDDNTFIFIKRIDDDSFLYSGLPFSMSTSQGTPGVKVCSVASRTITVGSRITFGISAGGNNSKPRCTDAINLSGTNWLFIISGDNATYSNYVKVFSGQINSSARTISYGSACDVTTSERDASSYLIRTSNTTAIGFYSTKYRAIDVNTGTNSVTNPNAEASNPITGSVIKFLPTTGDNIGVASYLNGSTYASIVKYTTAAGVISLGTPLVLTSSTASSTSLYPYDSDYEMLLYVYTTGGTAKMRKIAFVGGVLTALQEVTALNITTVYGKQKIIYITGGATSASMIFSSCDYDQYFALAQTGGAIGDSVQIKTIGQIFATTGLIAGKLYYLGNGSIVNDFVTGFDILGVAINETNLLLRK